MILLSHYCCQTEPPFRIENKVMKGEVISFDSQYTSVGELLFDSLKNNPDIIGQVRIDEFYLVRLRKNKRR